MSALDQAIIKAYAKDRPVVSPGPTRIVEPRTPAAAPPSGHAVEQLYHDGSLYRLHRSESAVSVPTPHLPPLPPTSPRRHVRRSVIKLLAANERSAAAAEIAISPPKVARKVIIRHVAHSATPPMGLVRSGIAVPHIPLADLPPETLIEEEEAPKLSPLAPPAAPQVAPLNVALEAAAPIDVKGPWLHEAAIAPMMMVADGLAATRHPAYAQHVVHIDALAAEAVEAQAFERQASSELGNSTLDLRENTGGDAGPTARKIYIEAAHPPGSHRPHARFRLDNGEANKPATTIAPAELPFAAAFEEVLASDLIPVEGDRESGIGNWESVDRGQGTGDRGQGTVESKAKTPAASAARPVWEVDRFHWPRTCEKLLADENGYLATAGDKLLAAVQDGLRVLAVTGTRRGEGRSTLALCLARAAARAGIEVAVMDADFQRPQLASKLGLETAFGWQDAALGAVPLSEAAIKSLADDITVMPLQSGPATRRLSLADPRVTATIRAAAATFELLILDFGPVGRGEQVAFPHDEACPLDAAIVVRDLRFTSVEEAEAVGGMLHTIGIEAVGIAENFAMEDELPATSV